MTDLNLRFPQNSSSRFTLEKLLDRLAATPTLKVLNLQCFFLPCLVGSAAGTSDRIVSLPNLKKLAIYGTVRDAATIIQHVDMPLEANLRIFCTSLGVKCEPPLTFPFSAITPARSYTCSLDMPPALAGHSLAVRGYMRPRIHRTLPWPEDLIDDRWWGGYDINVELHIPVNHRPLLRGIFSPSIRLEALVVWISPIER
ncbi:hypothetical protein BV25DRAFT_1036295 [Artomyces pyxidatus]|uniref:Uncharacterized protein n=1 Tax=Artomyces pyxidatus TaxID=48021 RepID=A0ACB8STN0_9AGAM|nr:hypothetical protein BV25DRAFT_1036295 [Artomyces pyxidatus]